MTSKERVKTAVELRKPDRVPTDFRAARETVEKLCTRFGVASKEELLDMWDPDQAWRFEETGFSLDNEDEEDSYYE